MMGGHSWRPAHVHFKVRADGFHTLTTQSHFEQGEYVDDDCCNGVRPIQIKPDVLENGEKVIENDFQLAPAVIAARAACSRSFQRGSIMCHIEQCSSFPSGDAGDRKSTRLNSSH